jgi:hypothetical protein
MTDESLLTRLKALSAKIRERGFDSLFYSLSWRLPKWLFQYTHALLVAAPDLDVVRPQSDKFEFRLALPSDAEAYALLGVSAETVKRRLAQGDVCGVAVRTDRMVCSMVWASTGRLYLDGVGAVLETDPEGVYVYNSFTLAELRGHSLYRGCSSAVCDWFRQHGRKVRYGIIETPNVASFEANGRINLKPAGDARYFRILGLHLTWLSNWPKSKRKLFLSLGKRTRGARVV